MTLADIGTYAAIFMILSLPLCFYVMFTKLETAENHFERSALIATNKYMFSKFIFAGRHIRLLFVTLIILLPTLYQSRNLVDPAEVASLPKTIKLWIVIPYLSNNLALFLAMAIGLTGAYEI